MRIEIARQGPFDLALDWGLIRVLVFSRLSFGRSWRDPLVDPVRDLGTRHAEQPGRVAQITLASFDRSIDEQCLDILHAHFPVQRMFDELIDDVVVRRRDTALAGKSRGFSRTR